MEANLAFVSLGCDKNLVDSEVMLGLAKEAGFTLVPKEEDADVIVVNTCCFIKDALEESIETILELAKLKEERLKALIVAGCLGQRYQKEIFEEMPEVDAVVGTTALEDVVDACVKALGGNKHFKDLQDINFPIKEENSYKRILSTPGYYGYLKIAEGCDNRCTYCIIPKLRGNYRSRTIESLVKEAEILAGMGVKELILVAQDTAPYGKDIYGKSCLAELLQKLCRIDGFEWIRILYCYPEHISEDMIEVMKNEPKICHYLDMPIQHASDTMLKRMGRQSTKKELLGMIQKLRDAVPDIALRTSLIVGFPGETEEEFLELFEFVKEIRFDRLGVFTYSQEEGTPAASMECQIPEEEKEERRRIIMEAQKEISAEKCSLEIGKNHRVLVEGKLPEDGVYCARSYKDAPEIDGMVFVSSEEELLSGDFVMAHILEASEYDLIGEVTQWK